jgi:hypothetical protein
MLEDGKAEEEELGSTLLDGSAETDALELGAV